MKYLFAPKSIFLVLAFIALFHHNSNAQVGIGTVTPQGSLDIDSATQGVVLPRVELQRTDDITTVINPNTPGLLSGTVVYNTYLSSGEGDYSVYPGIYVWIVDKWVPQFNQKQSVLLQQVGTDFRTSSNAGFQNITLDASTFTAAYSGTYKIELSVNFGGGYLRSVNNTLLNVGSQTGNFRLRYNNGADVDYFIPIKSYSARYRNAGTYYAIWKQQSIVFYVNINAGDTPTFELSIDQDFDSQFYSNGNSSGGGYGRGNVGDDIPCTIEIDYKGA